ncbi:MAG: regulatory iron-sulfur-containing complex subunit RicT [Chitinophagales bacterium]|nr:regulatory iron-sulfur-containing complex subunit RicT [Chitinophagales bacterium]
MGCGSCGGSCGTPSGCGDSGACASGACNKMNSYDWLTDVPVGDLSSRYPYVEVAFKNGQRKDFYLNPSAELGTGDFVCVESSIGMDIGTIVLSGDLVRYQMKKKNVQERTIERKVTRLASQEELQKLKELRAKEEDSMIKARVIARNLKLEMKISDVEFQADARKAIFYYIADGRVDFRELIKVYAREFNVKVEMKQIGSRQEAGLVGGIGMCGRELCCSTWLSTFKNVNITVVRYQNLSINQAKLSGQCGRLKCCLNFELDTYLDALKVFPKNADKLHTERGDAYLQKTDIFKFLMWYSYPGSTKLYPLNIERVREILELNKQNKPAADLDKVKVILQAPADQEPEHVDLAAQTSISSLRKTAERNKKKNKDHRGGGEGRNPNANQNREQRPASNNPQAREHRDKRNNRDNKGPQAPKSNVEGGAANNGEQRPQGNAPQQNRDRRPQHNRNRPQRRDRNPNPNNTNQDNSKPSPSAPENNP